MKKLCGGLVGLCLALGLAGGSAAQDKSKNMMGVPKVLTVTREFVKPGKTGDVHDKAESAFVKAMTAAKWPTHYIGLNSLSGKQRCLFLSGYDTFEAWEKDNAGIQKNATLAGALDRASVADGALLDAMDQSVWVFREDQSMHPTASIADMRFMEFEVFEVKPGHEGDWDAAVKLVKDAYAKGIPDASWDMFQAVYGRTTSYVVITPLKSLSEVDRNFMASPKFVEAMGADGMKKLGELSAAALASIETNLFSINPHMSYVSDEVAASAPDFWRSKDGGAPAAKAKAKAKPATP
jgi:hypothetical protein